jgi:16S rRNA (cytosine967-C5)-methyltransferase
MIAPARWAAYGVLRAVNHHHSDLPAALARARIDLKDERDRALAGEIATGTLRWQATFDCIIAAYAQRRLDRLDSEIVDILRLSLFQLLHLDRVPASAAVNDAVNLARKAGKKSAAPLVNALLRRASRERGRLPLPQRTLGNRETELDYLSTTLSHPRWLVARWRDRYGFDPAEAWCQFDNSPAALTIRANRLRISREALADRLAAAGVATHPTRFARHGLQVVTGNPLLTPLVREGLFVVQDEASQLIAAAVAAAPGERVLDACAAPGGKTTAMAADMGDRGLIVAADARHRRVRLLAAGVQSAGAVCVRVVQADATEALPFRQEFDCVLVDAPCSGLGTLRRDPDIKWRRTDAGFEEFAELQLTILRRAGAVVRQGGRMIYATCSSEPEENEQVVERFLAEQEAFRLRPIELTSSPQLVESTGFFRTLPFRDGLEGFFAALMVKARDLG